MRETLHKYPRYFLTGGTAAIVDAGGFAVLHECGVGTLPAALASFALAAVVNYRLTARFVFGRKATGGNFLLFVSVALVGLLLNVSVTLAAHQLFGLPPVAAKVVGIGVAFSANFLLNLFVVFRGSYDRQ